jgi:uncharacterized protein
MEVSPEIQTAIAALRGAYAAFNRGDVDAALEPLDDQIEWTEPVEFPDGGTCHGREGVKGYLTQSRAAWAEVSSQPERFLIAGDRIVVFVHARVRPKDSKEWQEVRLTDAPRDASIPIAQTSRHHGDVPLYIPKKGSRRPYR